jgi:hypothetical protein
MKRYASVVEMVKDLSGKNIVKQRHRREWKKFKYRQWKRAKQ